MLSRGFGVPGPRTVDGVDLEGGSGWVDPSLQRQRAARQPHPCDGLGVEFTYRQVTVIAGLIDAAAQGHDLREALGDVQAFLWLSAHEVCAGPGTIRINDLSNPAEAWDRVESWPLPPPGPPRCQPQ